MCVLLLIEEVLADQTTCFVAALEVSILAEKSNSFGVIEIEQFSTLGLLSKAIEWKTGESGGDAAKESSKTHLELVVWRMSGMKQMYLSQLMM